MKFKLVLILVLISGGNVLAAESPMGADRIPLAISGNFSFSTINNNTGEQNSKHLHNAID